LLQKSKIIITDGTDLVITSISMLLKISTFFDFKRQMVWSDLWWS